MEFTKNHSIITQNILSFIEEVPLISTNNDEMIAKLCLGTPSQCFNVLIDTGSLVLWIAGSMCEGCKNKNKYTAEKSDSYENLTYPFFIKYGTGRVEGYISKENISINEVKIDNINFLLVNNQEDNEYLDGILGLGYKYDNYQPIKNKNIRFSLVDQLYQNKLIEKRIFTQKYRSYDKGIMFLGDYPDEVKNNPELYSTCDTLPFISNIKNYFWQCNLRGVFFGYDNVNDTILLNVPAMFDTGTNHILAPYDFYASLSDTYFKEYIDKGLCKLKLEKIHYSYECNYLFSISNFPDINFIFGDYAMKLTSKDLFYRTADSPDKVKFFIISNLEINEWIIGQPLLKLFHMIFSKEDEKIGFYGGPKYNIDLPYPNPYIGIMIIGIIMFLIAFITLIVFLIIKYMKKKRSAITYYDPNMYLLSMERNRIQTNS